MKTYQLRDILLPEVKVKKEGDRLEVLGTEELMQDEHIFTFTVVYGFEINNDKGFVKHTNDFETILGKVSEYLKEQKFELIGDTACQKIIDRLDRMEKDFHAATIRGQAIKKSTATNLEISNFVEGRKLKSYQVLPVQHMLEIPNAANFSIPGSGKTTMTYAVYDRLKSNSSIDTLFVVGPLSSFKPWEEEFTNCFGLPYEESVLRYVGTPNQRKTLADQFDDFKVILTSLRIVKNDFQTLKENLFEDKDIMLVLDESHHIKSFTEKAKHAKTMISIGKFAKKRIILTGTPMPHSWPDLWSQITFLYPDESVLGSRLAYKSAIERIDASSDISKKIDFLWTRVTHKQMENDLPEMIPKICAVPMSPLQNKIYQALEYDWIASLEQESNLDINEISELKRTKTLRLLQCVTNPGTIVRKDIEFDLEPYETDNVGIMENLRNYKEVPNKIAKAASLAMQLAEQGKNVIIWTVFRHNVKYLCGLLADMNPIEISGEIPTETDDIKKIMGRDELIQTFKHSKGKIMVATLGSIAESVSLHRNDVGEPVCQNAIYLERNFNAGQFMQSLFRLYRIGSPQKIPVNNIFLTSTFANGYTGTIDGEIHERLNQRTKRMFRLMNDTIKLVPLNVDTGSHRQDGKSQFADEVEDVAMIYNKITKMIKKHQRTIKHDI